MTFALKQNDPSPTSLQAYPILLLKLHFSKWVSKIPRGTQVHCCTHAWRKSMVFCKPWTCKAGDGFRDLKCHFSGKKGGVVSKCTQISQTETYLGCQFWDKIPQNSCLGVIFLSGQKCIYRYISNLLFMHVYTCISESPPPPRLNCFLSKCLALNINLLNHLAYQREIAVFKTLHNGPISTVKEDSNWLS